MAGEKTSERRPLQRWRLRYSRGSAAAGLTQRDEAAAWTAALVSSGLPFVAARHGRIGVTFGPALVTGATALDEPLEFGLVERLPLGVVRSAVAAVVPAGHELRAIHDVWAGSPALPALVDETQYVLELTGADAASVQRAADALLARATLVARRVRAERMSEHDVRPLLVSLAAHAGDAADLVAVTMDTRLDPERGSIRPDEVVELLAGEARTHLDVRAIVRTRVRLRDEPEHDRTRPGDADRDRLEPPDPDRET